MKNTQAIRNIYTNKPSCKYEKLENIIWIDINHENKKKTDECNNIFSLMYMVLVFGLLFYVKNDWCDLLFKNFTVGAIFKIVTHFQNCYFQTCYFQICDGQEIFGLNVNHLGKLGVSSKGLYQGEHSRTFSLKSLTLSFILMSLNTNTLTIRNSPSF